MALLGDLIVRVGGDVAPFKTAMTDVSRTTTSAMTTVQTSFSGLTGIFQNVASSLTSTLGPAMGGLQNLLTLGPGPGLIAGALVGVATTATTTALEYEAAFNKIAAATGATGPLLETLQTDFRNVFVNVPQSADEVALAIGELNSRLGLTGAPLQALATQFLNLNDLTGEDLQGSLRSITRLFGDWGVETGDQAAAMDLLFAAGQKTGTSVTDLATAMVKFGAPLRQLGFDLPTAAATLAQFEAQGVNTELVMGSLRIALTRMADAGVTDAGAALSALTENIKGAGSAGEANALSIQLFGAKAGPDMAAAIREGRFEINDLIASLDGSAGAIARADAATETLSERAGSLWRKLQDLLEPIGRLIISLGEGLIGSLEAASRGFAGWAQAFDKLKSGDFSGVWDTLKNGADQYRGAQDQLTTSTAAVTAAHTTVGGAAKGAAGAHDDLHRALSTLPPALTDTKNALAEKEKALKANEAAARALEAAANDVHAAERALDPTVRSVAGAQASLASARWDVKDATENLKTAEANLADKIAAGKTPRKELEAATEAVETARKNLKKATDNQKEAEQDLTEAEKAAKKETDTFIQTMKDFGDQLDTSTTAAYDFGVGISKIPPELDEVTTKARLGEAALRDLGVKPQAELDELARNAEYNFGLVKKSGVASATDIDNAWVAMMTARQTALRNAGTDLPLEEQKMLDAMLARQAAFREGSTGADGVFTKWAESVKSITSTLGTDSLQALFSGEGFGGITGKLSGIKDAFVETFTTQIGGIIDGFIQNGIGALLRGLGGVIEKLTGSGGVGSALSSVFGATTPGFNGGSIPGLGGSGAGLPNIPLPSGGLPVPANAGQFGGLGGAAGALGGLSSFAGIVGGIGSAVSAVTDVLGMFGVGRSGEMDRFNIIANNTSYLAWAFSIGGLHEALLNIRDVAHLTRDFWFPAFDEKLQDIRWNTELMRDRLYNIESNLDLSLDHLVENTYRIADLAQQQLALDSLAMPRVQINIDNWVGDREWVDYLLQIMDQRLMAQS